MTIEGTTKEYQTPVNYRSQCGISCQYHLDDNHCKQETNNGGRIASRNNNTVRAGKRCEKGYCFFKCWKARDIINGNTKVASACMATAW